jgi:hypothetical protein
MFASHLLNQPGGLHQAFQIGGREDVAIVNAFFSHELAGDYRLGVEASRASTKNEADCTAID